MESSNTVRKERKSKRALMENRKLSRLRGREADERRKVSACCGNGVLNTRRNRRTRRRT